MTSSSDSSEEEKADQEKATEIMKEALIEDEPGHLESGPTEDSSNTGANEADKQV